MSRLALPRQTQPEATIVMPVYGAANWARRALEAVLAHTDASYELVVIDDASPDGAGERLREDFAGVTVLQNRRNIGFGSSCNRGAAIARGRYVVFLNSDALPHPGWLRALLDRLARPGTGAVGPRLLNLDGTLQQAGVLVGAGGRTAFYGYGDDPDAPQYAFARVCDYVSGACLAVRRADFTASGGFDPAYGSGYYEDADLCLRLRARGLRTWYEPRSIVTHVHRASSTEADAVALTERNRGLFATRHAAVLANRAPLADDPRARLAARDDPSVGRVLIVAGDAAADAMERLVCELAAASPEARLTIVGTTHELRRGEIETLGVDLEEAAYARRYAYDVVLLVGDVPAPLRDVVAAAQPQAAIVEDALTETARKTLVAAGVPTL